MGLKNLALSKITRWIQSLDGYIVEGKDYPLSPSHFCSNMYQDNIELFTHDTLAKSVSDSWNKKLSVKTFRNLHGRLRVVLVCVFY